jgi:hypothetical protein
VRRFVFVLLATPLLLVPVFEYREWKDDVGSLVPDTGRITQITPRRCRVQGVERRRMCHYARIAYPVTATALGTFAPDSAIALDYRIGDEIPILVDPKNRRHVRLGSRNATVFGFLRIESLLAVGAFVLAVLGAVFAGPGKRR